MKARKNKIFPRILLGLSIVLFLVSGFRLYQIFSRYQEGRDSCRKAEETAGITEDSKKTEPEFMPDLAALKRINPDCVGYLYCKDVLSYPIVRGGDNSYYLTHLFDGTENIAGAVFMDARCSGFDDRNCILYGHNMQDGSMFGSLYRYEEERFYQEHPVIDVFSESGHDRYRVLAAYRTPVDGTAYKIRFSQEAEFQSFLKESAGYRSYEIPEQNLQDAEAVLTLSTCTWDSSDTERFVVVCVREERSDPIAAHQPEVKKERRGAQ